MLCLCGCSLGKPAERIANGDRIIAGQLATGHKCEQVAKAPKYGHVMGVCGWHDVS